MQKSNDVLNHEIMLIDSTLRDGSHAMRHQITAAHITQYARGAEMAGMPIVVVGHGNGLGASSLHLGRSLLSDLEMLKTAKKELHHSKLGAFLIPGFGTIKRDIDPAIAIGIEAIMIACHCTEANITRQHIEYGKSKNLLVFGILMMSHMIGSNDLLEQAKLMESYGVDGVILMDSAGTFLPHEVEEKISLLVDGLSIPVGFHAHNNLGLAVANSLVAVENGATIIDGTTRGLGAGAGNCQLEVITAVLARLGYPMHVDPSALMDLSEDIVSQIMMKPQEITRSTLASGLSGVFSGFAPLVEKAAKRFDVDIRDIFMELGKRKVVAGQEDIIVDVAMNLAQKKKSTSFDFQLESLS